MIEMSERIAVKFGTPWLRVDFFVGGKDGLKMNELAFGSGIAYPMVESDMRTSMTLGFAANKYKLKPPSYFMRPMGCEVKKPPNVLSVECELLNTPVV